MLVQVQRHGKSPRPAPNNELGRVIFPSQANQTDGVTPFSPDIYSSKNVRKASELQTERWGLLAAQGSFDVRSRREALMPRPRQHGTGKDVEGEAVKQPVCHFS